MVLCVPASPKLVGWADRDLGAGARAVQRNLDRRLAGKGPAKRRAPQVFRATLSTVEAQVAARMPGHDRALRRQVARAIYNESMQTKLDPLLVLALIHVESSFNPRVVSSAGAMGLMQLREATLRSELERSGLGSADPHDPVANVRAGIRYLRRLMDAFGNNIDLALMAYNAGPNRIRTHARAGAIPARFRVYPRRIRGELAKFRLAAGSQKPATLVGSADAPARPVG